MLYDNLFCKVYIKNNSSIDEIYQDINGIVMGELKWIRTIKTDWGEIDLRRNSNFESNLLEVTLDDFIYWPYFIEIEPIDNISQNIYIKKISMLLQDLKLKGYCFVASCDFENNL